MRIAVTGAAGFVGSCILWKLNSEGVEEIIAVDAAQKLTPDYKNLSSRKFQDYLGKDRFLDYLKDDKLKYDIDMIIHMGACTDTTERNVEFLKENNLEYSKILAEWAYKNNKPYLYASSAAVYGAGELGYSDDDGLTSKLNALNEYGNSKLEFDKWVIENGLQKRFVGFRFFNVYGPNEYHKGEMRSMVNKGYHQIKQTGKMRLFKSHKPEYKDGQQKRDFVYVKDALDIVWYFLQHPDRAGIYNVGTGDAKSWNELANALFAALKLTPNIEYFDMPEDLRNQYQYFTQADLTKLKKTGCNIRFTPVNDAVKDYVGHLEQGLYL